MSNPKHNHGSQSGMVLTGETMGTALILSHTLQNTRPEKPCEK